MLFVYDIGFLCLSLHQSKVYQVFQLYAFHGIKAVVFFLFQCDQIQLFLDNSNLSLYTECTGIRRYLMTANALNAFKNLNIEYRTFVDDCMLSFSKSTGKDDGLC